MKLRALFASKSFLLKIVLWISASVLFIVGILSVIIYLNAQSLMINKESDNSKKILLQVKYNTNIMNETMSRLTQSLYLNNDITSIMYAEQENIVDVITRINNVVNSLTSSYPYIHSISVYNRNLDQFYNAGSPIFFDDPQLLALFNSNQLLPKLKPIFRDIHKVVNETNKSERVLSYFMYETSMNIEKPNGAVVINVKPEWLLGNIKQINMVDRQQGNNIYLLDQHGDYIDVDENQEHTAKLKWLKDEVENHTKNASALEAESSFKSKFMDTQYLVTYLYLDSINMTLLKIQPTLEVYGYIQGFKTSIIFITLIFLVMAIVISVSISRKIYSPIGNLVQTISSGRLHKFEQRGKGDEISYLDYVYKQSMEKLKLYDKQIYQYGDVMKHYWLNRILTENLKLDNAELERIFLEMKISLPLDTSYAILLLKIDNYKDFQRSFSSKDKETIRYAMINITSEWISRAYINEGLDLKDDHVVLILSIPQEHERFETNVTSFIQEAQQYVQQFYKITFTASISPISNTIDSLHTLYNKALDQTVYRFIYGHNSILDAKGLLLNEDNPKTGYAKILESHLQEALRKRNLADIEDTMRRLFDDISQLNYYNALASTFRLLETTKKTLESSSEPATPSLLIDLSSFSLQLMEKETLTSIHETIFGAIKDSLETKSEGTTNKVNHYVVETVAEYIETHFQDPSLCLASIASIMKISQRRLGNLFKDAMHLSVADYINETRLAKAAEYLSESEISVREIVEKIGVLNETYFFSLFKKHFGITPKEYALKSNVKQLKTQKNELES
ncbi:helix-turn-helix domain-containing protein [Paenibacillus sp. LMG 31461]|uniref:Helix-turn-helix domain-containing protein n=1 Tax=Paenibacillus plantarum TaxID=2654975 RepID=A0ABX1XLC7_9BACL|nr:helix-turn-helix domain-containing protein [Paenibacillus plantarum]NOU69239.1 helix-turn-helix domain-containing protein [Paenibacillus plantarum]